MFTCESLLTTFELSNIFLSQLELAVAKIDISLKSNLDSINVVKKAIRFCVRRPPCRLKHKLTLPPVEVGPKRVSPVESILP